MLKVLVLLLLLTAGGLVAWRAFGPEQTVPVAVERATPVVASRVSARAEVAGRVPEALRELSGLAVSRAQPGVVWAHNDSGHEAILYALTEAGQLLRAFRLEGAPGRDWEDISLGPCPSGAGGDCLFVGDTGNNARRRRAARIVIVREPAVTAGRETVALPWRAVAFRYPGRQPNVEALAIAPDGRALLLSKNRRGIPTLFELSPAELASDADTTFEAREAGRLRLPSSPPFALEVTGAAFARTDSVLVVRTYFELFFYDWRPDGLPVYHDPICELGALEPQGEAVDFISRNVLLVASESWPDRPGQFHRVTCE